MGFSFRKSFKFGGTRVNLSRKGLSTSVGGKGLRVGAGGGRRARVTGGWGPFRYYKSLGSKREREARSGCGCLNLVIILIGGTVLFSLFNRTPDKQPASPVVTLPPQEAPVPPPKAEVAASMPAPPVPEVLPRNVTVTQDIKVNLEYGILNVRRGQAVQLLKRNGDQYQAVFGSHSLDIQAGQFQELP